MPDPVEIFVKNDPKPTQPKGDWTVRVGRGRGGRDISSHRSKEAAISRGRREGRKREDQPGGAVLKAERSSGRGRPELIARYGDAQSSGGLFGGLF